MEKRELEEEKDRNSIQQQQTQTINQLFGVKAMIR
jgi:hypothetical protein